MLTKFSAFLNTVVLSKLHSTIPEKHFEQLIFFETLELTQTELENYRRKKFTY